MTVHYVSAATGSNSNNGTTWALAKQTVAAAFAGLSLGDLIAVDNTGTFTANAAISWNTSVAHITIASVLRSGTTGYTYAAGAKESLGSTSGLFSINPAANSSLYIYGMTISNGSSTSVNPILLSQSGGSLTVSYYLENCTFDVSGATTSQVRLSQQGGQRYLYILKNCTITPKTGTTPLLFDRSDVEINGLTVTGSVPAIFAAATTSGSGVVTIKNCDFSGVTVTGNSYFDATFATGEYHFTVKNCKFGATPFYSSSTMPTGSPTDFLIRNCDSTNTTYTYQYINVFGTLTATITIYQNAGAKFNSAGISWQVVTTSICSVVTPFITPPIQVWTNTLTSQTASIEIIRDNATALTDQDIWSEIDYSGSASFPLYSYTSNRNAAPVVGTPANQTTSTATWIGTGGFSNPNKQSLQNTFTTLTVGLLSARISVAVPSTTLYVDPFISGIT